MKRLSHHRAFRSATCAFAFGFVCLYGAQTAFADTDQPLAQLAAHQQFERALDLNESRDFAGAKKLLLELWSQFKTYDVASELGRTEFQLGDMASSAKHTAFALAHLPPHEQADTVKLHQSRLNRALAKIQKLTVIVTPSNATIAVDGIGLDVPAEVGLYLAPGAHTITVSSEGYQPETRTLTAKENQSDHFSVELKRLPQKVIPSTADTSNTSPVSPLATTTPPPSTPPQNSKPWAVLAIGGSLTALAIGSGVYFHVSASNAEDDATAKAKKLSASGGCTMSPLSAGCTALNRDLSDRNSGYRSAKILYGVGAVLGVATAITWAIWPTQSSQASARVGAWATPDGAGVAANGSF